MNSKQRDIWENLVQQCKSHAHSHINVAIKVRSEIILAMNVAYREMELTAHIHDKACGELAQTVHTVRQLRQGEEQRAVTAEARVDHLSQALNAEVELRQEAEQRADRNETLAALVNEETAELLRYLAEGIDCLAPAEPNAPPIRTDEAYALASKIRKVLNDSQA